MDDEYTRLTDTLTPDQQTATALYEQVQTLKMLLYRWTRTSYLNRQQKLNLRRETRTALKKSSTVEILEMYRRKLEDG